MKSLLVSLVALVSIGLVGCGAKATVAAAPPDVSPTGEALTVEAYSAKLTELGTESQKEMEPIQKAIADAKAEPDAQKKMDMVTTAFESASKFQDGMVQKYEAINPPTDLAKAHAVIVQANKDIAQNFREGVASMKNREDDKTDALMTKLQTIAQDLIKNLTAELDKAGYKLDDSGNIIKK